MTEWLTPEVVGVLLASLGLGGGEGVRRGLKTRATAQKELVASIRRSTARIELSLDALEPLVVALADACPDIPEQTVAVARIRLEQAAWQEIAPRAPTEREG